MSQNMRHLKFCYISIFYNSSSFDFLHNADKLSKIYKMDKKRHKKISPKHIKRNQTETKSTKLTLKQRRLQQS